MAPSVDISRRRLLGGAVLGTTAAGLGWGARTVVADAAPAPTGPDTIAFYGAHQAGITTEPPAVASFVGLDLRAGADRSALTRILRLWTEDGHRLTQGEPALADTEPELAFAPSRMTVTVGLGAGAFAAAGLEGSRPRWLRPLPEFSIDRFDGSWPATDLILQVCSDDAVALSHAVRVLTKNVRSMASVAWIQRGFRTSRGAAPDGATMRNLMGQLDGTVNPKPVDFDALVWDDGAEQPWLAGGTSMVLRRIRMEMDTWDEVDPPLRNLVMGRTQSAGAPLTGTTEHDVPDFAATDEYGITIIPPASHVARAHQRTPDEQFLRRSYNYDEPPELGLIFATYQRDVDRQFTPVQRRLAEQDALNEWTTPVGSAVYAILPGVRPGGYLGSTLLEG